MNILIVTSEPGRFACRESASQESPRHLIMYIYIYIYIVYMHIYIYMHRSRCPGDSRWTCESHLWLSLLRHHGTPMMAHLQLPDLLPISLMILSLLRFVDSKLPGHSLWTCESHPLTSRILFIIIITSTLAYHHYYHVC